MERFFFLPLTFAKSCFFVPKIFFLRIWRQWRSVARTLSNAAQGFKCHVGIDLLLLGSKWQVFPIPAMCCPVIYKLLFMRINMVYRRYVF